MANQIESLPETLKECRNLTHLRMSYRSFNSLLDTYMENLISKGQIKSEHIPMVVFELGMLSELDLQLTKINQLPENNLKNLKSLHLDSNYFENFTQPQQQQQQQMLTSSTPTNLAPPMPSLLTISEYSVFNAMSSTLCILTVSHNLLKEVPIELMCLGNLEVLDLSFNSIKRLPPNFYLLAKLKQLYLHNNILCTVNPSLGLLKQLEKLTLNNNELVDFTEEVNRKNGEVIERTAGLPDSLYDNLAELTHLDLSYNKLTHISPKICNLLNIKVAHSYNRLNEKEGLWLMGNPLKIPPKEIWQTQNVRKIYNYLSSYVQRNLSYVYYAKLIFMGKSGVGKSHLVDSFFMDTCLSVSQQQHHYHHQKFESNKKLDETNTNKIEDKAQHMSQSFVINDEFEEGSLTYIMNKPNSGYMTNRSANNQNFNSTSRNNVTSRISGMFVLYCIFG